MLKMCKILPTVLINERPFQLYVFSNFKAFACSDSVGNVRYSHAFPFLLYLACMQFNFNSSLIIFKNSCNKGSYIVFMIHLILYIFR